MTLFGIFIFSILSFCKKAPSPISVHDSGNVTFVKFLHNCNAPLPIVVISSGITIFSKPVQPANKNCATCLVPVSNDTLLNRSHFSNGPSVLPKLSQYVCAVSNDFGISISVIAVSANAAVPKSFNLEDNITCCNSEHCLNASLPIVITLFGISIFSIFSHCIKAPAPISVHVSGNVTLVKLLHN